MVELLRTNDLVLISWLRAILAEEGIEMVVLDNHTSVLEGSALAIPRRVMVAEADHARAGQIYNAEKDKLDVVPDVIVNDFSPR